MVDQLPPNNIVPPPEPQKPAEKVSVQPGPQNNPLAQGPLTDVKPVEEKKLFSKKTWVILLAGLLILLIGGGVMPVKNIPVLSTLTKWIGYSEEQMENLSFFQALLFWADDERGPEARLQEGIYNVFASSPDRFDAIKRGTQKYGAVGEGGSTLIDFGALNASLRRQGKTPDAIAGVARNTGKEEKDSVVRLSKNIKALSKEARASAEIKPDMYYGADTSLKAAEPGIAFDGTQQLKGLKAGIMGAAPKTDWRDEIFKKAVQEDVSDLDRKLGGSSSMLMLENARGAITDFRYVWLTSQASRRAKQIPLKKTLAAAGFFAEDMPQKVFTATGGIAVAGLEEDDVVADIGEAKIQEQRQRECEQASKLLGPQIQTLTASVVSQINALRGTFPNFPGDCENPSKVNAWRTALAQVRSSCTQVKRNYNELGDKCLLQLKYNRGGQCTTDNLDDKLNEYDRMCAEYLQDKKEAGEEGEVDMSIYNPEQFSDQQVTESVHGTFNVPVWGGSAGTSTPNDFFPETDLSSSQNWSYLDEPSKL